MNRGGCRDQTTSVGTESNSIGTCSSSFPVYRIDGKTRREICSGLCRWTERTREAQKQSQVLQDKIRALQREVLDMDQSLETTQAELITAQKRLATRENELRSVSEVHERNIQALEEKLKKVRLDKESLEISLRLDGKGSGFLSPALTT